MATTEYLNNRTFETLIVKFQECKREKLRRQKLIEDFVPKKQSKSKKAEPVETLEDLEKNLKSVCLEFEEIQKQLAYAFYTLSQNIVRYAKFNLIDQDDAVQEGVMICFEKIDRFDPQKGKAFNYMTTCILNHFRQLYRTARNYNELKRKYLDFLQVQLDQQLPPSKAKSIYKKHNIAID